MNQMLYVGKKKLAWVGGRPGPYILTIDDNRGFRPLNPVLVEVTRGSEVESIHRGSALVAHSDGRILEKWGDICQTVFARSAIKPLQCLPLVESGAASAFGVTDPELALACGSHNGEGCHVELVAAWLQRLGLGESDLCCGAHEPMFGPAARELHRYQLSPTRLHNNCSGKHAGFLTLAKYIDATLPQYCDQNHPVQLLVVRALAELSGVERSSIIDAKDGCGAPTFGLPLMSIAQAFASLTRTHGVPATRRNAINRILSAMRDNPFLIAGTNRSCTVFIEKTCGDVIAKFGAEGVYAAVLPRASIGIAVKIDDGAMRASEIAMAALLHRYRVLDDSSLLQRPILNTVGERVGALRPSADAFG